MAFLKVWQEDGPCGNLGDVESFHEAEPSKKSLWQLLANSIFVHHDSGQTLQLIIHLVVPWSVLSPPGCTQVLEGMKSRGCCPWTCPGKCLFLELGLRRD